MEIIVETPRNSRTKYEYDAKTGHTSLKKILPLGMVFPYDFGFIPGTKGEDGDPLDALVISEFTTFPGCRLDCRLIGVLKAEQSEKKKMVRNDRYFFIPVDSLMYKGIESVKDFPSAHNRELLLFFIAYNQAAGKEFRPLKLIDAGGARTLLKKQ